MISKGIDQLDRLDQIGPEADLPDLVAEALHEPAATATAISATATGLLTGLATVLASWLLDRMDLFGVVAEERVTWIDTRLDSMLANT